MSKQRHLITSAIPYVNGVKHLGNLIGSMLPADVYARFRRQQGHEVLFICGTDDHGTPVEIAAQKAGQPVADFVAYWHDFQENIYARFGLSFDHFGSSSRPQNHALTQHFARQLHAAGLLEVKTERMLYSEADQRFLPDRYVEGECPHCHYANARGDQCDNCSRVLDPTDLINPRSSISGSTALEIRETRHLHFKQSDPALLAKLTAWIESKTDWPHLSRSIALKWLAEGLQDRGITRDINWGVPVPVDTFGDAFAGKVFYVWFDAPIAYIAATQEWAEKHGDTVIPADGPPLSASARRWWYDVDRDVPAPSQRSDAGGENGLHDARAPQRTSEVREERSARKDILNPAGAGALEDGVVYTEFMGKDNVYFHTVSFPATLLGSGEPWKKVDTLKSFNWLTYYGGKFSTSLGVGIFTDTALELLADNPSGADYWRYYLLSRAPESDDASFTWSDLQAVVNKDLADVLGNFINRSVQLTNKHFGAVVPAQSHWTDAESALASRLQTLVTEYTGHLAQSDMRKAVEKLREAFVAGNEYLAAQQPWQVIKTDKPRAATILSLALNLIPVYARLMAPLAPYSANRLMEIFGLTETGGPAPKAGLPTALHTPWSWPTDLKAALTALPHHHAFTLPPVLFPKITDDQVTDWEARFGNQKA